MTAVSSEVFRIVPPVLAAWFRGLSTSVRILESLLYEFIPRASSQSNWVQPANTENLAFLPPEVPGLAPINGKLIGGTPVPLREFHVGER
jgi:hypothetical protein